MNKTVIIALVLATLIMLAGCGGKQLTAKKLKLTPEINSAVTGLPEEPKAEPAPAPEETTEKTQKTAAEALKELQEQIAKTPLQTKTVTQANTGLPPPPEGVTGIDALKARTKSFYKQSTKAEDVENVDAEFGPKYHTKSGEPTNLPKGYGPGRDED